MRKQNINIALSDSCAYLAEKYDGCQIVNFKSGREVAEFFENADQPISMLIFGDVTPHDSLPDLNDYAALVYSSGEEFMIGSVRDNFDFGLCILVNNTLAKQAICFTDRESSLAGFYDFRLQISRFGNLIREENPFYDVNVLAGADLDAAHFAYCDPRNRDYQIEAEKVFTKFLKDIDCIIKPVVDPVPNFDEIESRYPVAASVIIPVKDRQEVIGDAILSALEQRTNFPFNVIVVDNHSKLPVREIAKLRNILDPRLIIIEPEQCDLGIGGCWNVAINDARCGAIAVQLDSDDVYASPNVLQTIVDKFYEEKCGVLVGSYRLTDIDLNPLNDIIIDHREYTQTNGVNNALRVNGFGAPRCYLTELVRATPFKNVSYGEDYDLCLRLSRRYKLSRIYDVLYLCRRWGKNSDANLTPEKLAKFNRIKDQFRTDEMTQRMR
ncbi:MAG: glycosyltransferase [Bacteroidales bacterium]|nr:glycosyltransferase [Bacteroidales bacterium]